MRIALFSDIHANLPALEAFFIDVGLKKPDVIYCLGDLVGYNIWPNEVISEIRKRAVTCISGNHDVMVQNLSGDPDGKNYAYQIIGEDERSFLKSLPFHIRIEFAPESGKKFSILLVHGSTESNTEYIFEDINEDYLLGMLGKVNADVLCCAHTHLPYHRTILKPDGSKNYHIINTGSAGKPKGGDPRGSYVILDINEGNPESLKVEIIRFQYDIERAAIAVEGSPLPDEFADRLRKAY